jgi:hypothetical protein
MGARCVRSVSVGSPALGCRLAGAGIATLLGTALPAAAQNEWLVQVTYSNGYSFIGDYDDTATINVWAKWDPSYYAFGLGSFSLHADKMWGTWSEVQSVLDGPIHDDGTINGLSIEGISGSQHSDPDQGVFPDESNPILVFSAVWSPSGEVKFGSVNLNTETSAFGLYADAEGSWDVVDGVEEGMGRISLMIPAPGAGAALAFGAGAAIRRRRRF